MSVPVNLSLFTSYPVKVRATLRNGDKVEGWVSSLGDVIYPFVLGSRRYDSEGRFWDSENPLDVVSVEVADGFPRLSEKSILQRIEWLESELARYKEFYGEVCRGNITLS